GERDHVIDRVAIAVPFLPIDRLFFHEDEERGRLQFAVQRNRIQRLGREAPALPTRAAVGVGAGVERSGAADARAGAQHRGTDPGKETIVHREESRAALAPRTVAVVLTLHARVVATVTGGGPAAALSPAAVGVRRARAASRAREEAQYTAAHSPAAVRVRRARAAGRAAQGLHAASDAQHP